jgi:hypothetical protein
VITGPRGFLLLSAKVDRHGRPGVSACWMGERALPLAEPSQDHSRKLEHLAARALDREAQQPEHQPFEQGYLAGWHSLRGADDEPVLIPSSPVFVGPMMYMVGFSRGARDAGP